MEKNNNKKESKIIKLFLTILFASLTLLEFNQLFSAGITGQQSLWTCYDYCYISSYKAIYGTIIVWSVILPIFIPIYIFQCYYILKYYSSFSKIQKIFFFLFVGALYGLLLISPIIRLIINE